MSYTVRITEANTTVTVAANTGISNTVVTAYTVGPIGPEGPPAPLRLMFFVGDAPGPREELFRLVTPEAYRLDSTRCAGSAANAATDESTFLLYQGNSIIAEFTFVAGSNTANITLSNTNIAQGSTLRFESPLLVDPTLRNIGFTVYGRVVS